MHSRRAFLATTATVLGAGCLDSRSGPGSCTAGFSIDAASFAPANELTVKLTTPQRAVVTAALNNNTTTVTTFGQPPIEDKQYVRHSGSFYQVNLMNAQTTDVSARLLNIEWQDGQTPPANATVVPFESLPDVDQHALRLAINGSKYSDEKHRHPTESLSINEYPAPYPENASTSRLVSGKDVWVRWQDRPYHVTVGGTDTATHRQYQYGVTKIAANTTTFRRHIAEQYLVRLTGVSPDVEEIVQKAVAENGYRECTPASDALSSLQTHLPDSKQLPFPGDGWYIQFNGDRYELRITQWVK